MRDIVINGFVQHREITPIGTLATNVLPDLANLLDCKLGPCAELHALANKNLPQLFKLYGSVMRMQELKPVDG